MPSASPRAAEPSAALSNPILAIDYGRRRLGLALSDPLGVTARPFAVWKRINRRHDLARLRELCRAHEVKRIVVGWPLRLDGTPAEMAGEARSFAQRLGKDLGLPVELADERLSSWEAEQMVREAAPARASRRSRQELDDVAAAVILRDFLSRARSVARA
jgi:putative pre-16S rRNA nuclease